MIDPPPDQLTEWLMDRQWTDRLIGKLYSKDTYSVFRKNCVYHNPLQPNPRLCIASCKRPFLKGLLHLASCKALIAIRVYSPSNWLPIFWTTNSSPEGRRGRGVKVLKILGKNTIFSENPESLTIFVSFTLIYLTQAD